MLPSYDLDVSQDQVIQTRETVLSDMTGSHRAPYLPTTTDAAVR